MCIIFINSSPIHDIKLILAFNRDEVKSRPTSPAHYWSDLQCYGGTDVSPGGVPGGTWLGVSRSGRVGALLNVHHKGKGIVFSRDKSSRGGLVPEFLKSVDSAVEYVETIRGGKYNYFNLVMGEFKGPVPSLNVYDFFQNKVLNLPSGVHCIGNLPPDYTNNRAQYGELVFSDLLQTFSKQNFSDMSSRDKYLVDQLFAMLSDKTEIPVEEGTAGSFRHIFNESYTSQDGQIEMGSVSSTVFIVDKMNKCHFSERTNFKSNESCGEIVTYEWIVE